MFKNGLSRAVWIFVLFTALTLHPATAQSSIPTKNTVEFVGSVTAFDGTAIIINGQRISIIGAEVKAALTVGTVIKVQGTLAADGSVIAREVTAAAATDIQPGEVEVIGTVTALQNGQLTVNGQTIDVSAAEIKAGVAVGQIVKIEGATNDQGQLVAREVRIFQPAAQNNLRNETEIKGTLDVIGDGFIVVSGQQISTANAEITTTLTVGALVEVKVSTVNGQVVASEVGLGHPEVENEINDINDDHSGAGNGNDDPAGDRSGSNSNINSGSGNSNSINNGPDNSGSNTNIGSGSGNGGSDNSGSGGSDSGSGKGGSGSGGSGGSDDHGGNGNGSDDGGGHK